LNKIDLIRELASPESSVRMHGASALFAIGRTESGPIVDEWAQDREFASLLLRHATLGRPLRVTVGLAVRPETFASIYKASGSPQLANVPPDQDAMEFELHFTAVTAEGEALPEVPIQLDILTTRLPEGQGAIARFLEKFGEGIQQVEYDVADADRATKILIECFGQKPVYPQTRLGADGTRVNFFLAARPDGAKMLIELVEHAAARPGL
jgi:hypothetical protein